jgi:chromosome segregation ATPase
MAPRDRPEDDLNAHHGAEVSLREFLEARLAAVEAVIEARTDAVDRERHIEREALEARLEQLNGLRKEVERDRDLFATNDRLTAAVRRLEDRTNNATERLDEHIAKAGAFREHLQLSAHPGAKVTVADHEDRLRILESWRNRATGAAIILSLIAGTIGAVIVQVFSGS